MEKLLKIWIGIMCKSRIQLKKLEEIEALLNVYEKERGGAQAWKNTEAQRRGDLLIKKLKQQIEQKRKMLEEEYIKTLEGRYQEELKHFFEDVNAVKGDEFAVVFSGTTYIQKVKVNRPIRLTLEYEKMGIPVLYSYWRWRASDHIPERERKLVLEIPIDQTIKYIMQIIKAPINKKYKTFILGFPYPPLSKYLELFKLYGWKVIYDIRDDWEEFHKVNQAKWYQKAHELYAIEKADYCIAVSKPLIKKFASMSSKHIELVPNALGDDFKKDVQWQATGRRKIGYVGHLTSGWMDWEGIIQVAKALPQYEFEMIGHSMPDNIGVLPSNMKYLGPKNSEQVQECVREWKVGIIPFKINALTEGVDPIKVYEYLSMGLKVVSFCIPQIVDYPEVKTAYNVEQFIKLTQEAMIESFNEIEVNTFLSTNTWRNRVEKIRGWR